MALLAPVVVWPRTRCWVLGMFWLLVTRHRLRQYFLQCGAYNRSGRLPWLTLSYPTPVGERVWVWLVAGLSLADFESDTAPDRGRLLGPRLPGRTRQEAGRPGLGRRHPPRPAHRVAALPVDPARHRHRDPGSHERPARGTAGPGVLGGEVGSGNVRGRPSPRSVAREDGPLDVPRTVIDLDALRTDTTGNGTGSGRRNGKPAAKRAASETAAPTGPRLPSTPITGRGGEDVSDWL